MNRDNLKQLLSQLKRVVQDLEAEVYSEPSNYKLDVDYKEVLKYFDTQDDDSEEGL